MSLMHRLPLKRRLLLAILIPILALLVVAVSQFEDKYATQQTATEAREAVAVAVKLAAIVHELQKERGLTAGYAGSHGMIFADEMSVQRKVTDEAVVAARNLEIASNVKVALLGIRSAISPAAEPGPLIKNFTSLIERLLGELQQAGVKNTGNVGAAIDGYHALAMGKEYAGQERAVMNGLLSSGTANPEAFYRLLALQSGQETYFRIATHGGRSFPELLDSSVQLNGPVHDMRQQLRTAMNTLSLPAITPAAWFAAATKRIDELKKIEDAMAQQAMAIAEEVATDARQAMFLAATVTIGSLLAALAIGLGIPDFSVGERQNGQ